MSLREQLLADKSGLFNAEGSQSRELVGAFSEFNIIYKHICMLLSIFDSDQVSGLAPELLFEARQGYKLQKIKDVNLSMKIVRKIVRKQCKKCKMSDLSKFENMDEAMKIATIKNHKITHFLSIVSDERKKNR